VREHDVAHVVGAELNAGLVSHGGGEPAGCGGRIDNQAEGSEFSSELRWRKAELRITAIPKVVN
jgi:hypothetical protein